MNKWITIGVYLFDSFSAVFAAFPAISLFQTELSRLPTVRPWWRNQLYPQTQPEPPKKSILTLISITSKGRYLARKRLSRGFLGGFWPPVDFSRDFGKPWFEPQLYRGTEKVQKFQSPAKVDIFIPFCCRSMQLPLPTGILLLSFVHFFFIIKTPEEE